MLEIGNVCDKWQTYPENEISLFNSNEKPKLIPVQAPKIEIRGRILSIKNKIFRIELDSRSLQLALKVAKGVNDEFYKECGSRLDSINIFDAGTLRFRRREYGSVFKSFYSLIGTNVTINIRPEAIYQGRGNSLNWVCESF